MDQHGAGTRRCCALSKLLDARRPAESGRTADHDGVQRNSDRTEFLGLQDFLRRLSSMQRTFATRERSVARNRALTLTLMVASGFAALGYQIVWTQQSTLWLGHESAAVLAVVAAFF